MTKALDATDRALIAALRRNARTPTAELARRLGLPRTTLQARIERLERSGVIRGYTLKLGPAARQGIRATVLLQVEPRASAGLVRRLETMPEIERALTCSGRFDLVLEVLAPSPAALDALLDRIGALPGVRSSESLVHLAERIDRRG